MSLDPALENVAEFRRTARRIIRHPDLTEMNKHLALLRLAELADSAPWPWAARMAVWTEAEPFVTTGDVMPVVSGDPVEAACRSLRRQGRERCPTCERAIPDEVILDRWQGLRLAAIAEAQRFEGGVE